MLDIKTSAAADYLSRSATFSTNFSMLFGESPCAVSTRGVEESRSLDGRMNWSCVFRGSWCCDIARIFFVIMSTLIHRNLILNQVTLQLRSSALMQACSRIFLFLFSRCSTIHS